MTTLHSILAFGAGPDLNVVYNVVGIDAKNYNKNNMAISRDGEARNRWYLQNIFGTEWAGKKIIVRTLSQDRKCATAKIVEHTNTSSEVHYDTVWCVWYHQ